jgi:hypothetical protein
MNYSIYIHLARIVLCVYYIMHHTRKNRSLKKKPKGLKKKSNKSSRKSKKSRRVNKRKIRGGLLFETKLSQDDFRKITENIEDSNESISEKVKMYIAAKERITACGGSLKSGYNNCESDKYLGYGHRAKLATILKESHNYDNEVTDADKEALKRRYNEWFALYNQHKSKYDSVK